MGEAYTGDYTDLRAAAEAAMRDTCKIGVIGAPASDDPGSVAYSYGSEIACGLLLKTRGELAADGSQHTLTTAVLRLPWGTSIGEGDRVQIVTQGGDILTEANLYAVDGAPFQSLISTQVNLKRIDTDSVL